MNLGRLSINQPILAMVLSIVLLIVGAIAYPTLPISEYPQVVPPTVVVTTQYPGASAQTVSYEVFMGLALMGIVVQVGSFNMRDIVEYQAQNLWFIIPQFFGFCTFFIAGVAVTHRHPFDQPEAEQELADGYHIEYAGMKWGMFFVGEYIGIILISALLVTLFFGGWHGPFGILPQLAFVWFALKTAFFIMLFILLRASIPRPRYDQVMDFSWKFCLPLTLINLLVTAAIVLWNTPAVAVQ